MPRLIDYTNRRFGRLTVLYRDLSPTLPSKHKVFWVCRCDCGTIKSIQVQSLQPRKIRGNKISSTKSCGCLFKEIAHSLGGVNRLPFSIQPKRNVYRHYRDSAKGKNLPFELTFDELIAISQRDCWYCGAKPSNVNRNQYNPKEDFFIYNGIDRVDSHQGYISGNVVPCCRTCNIAKLDLSVDEFYSWIERAHNHLQVSSQRPGFHYFRFADENKP